MLNLMAVPAQQNYVAVGMLATACKMNDVMRVDRSISTASFALLATLLHKAIV